MTGAHFRVRRVRAIHIACPIVMAAPPMEKTTPVITAPAANASDEPQRESAPPLGPAIRVGHGLIMSARDSRGRGLTSSAPVSEIEGGSQCRQSLADPQLRITDMHTDRGTYEIGALPSHLAEVRDRLTRSSTSPSR